MKQIVEWLLAIEDLARTIYKEAAVQIPEDSPVSRFLAELAEDEASHFELLGRAAGVLDELEQMPTAAIEVDSDTRRRLEAPLHDCRQKIQRGKLREKDVIGSLVEAEFSEWNDIFVYVMRTCQNYSKTFQHAAANIQAHAERVEAFLDGLPEELKPAHDLWQIPKIWTKRYLIVEDDPVVSTMFEHALSSDAEVLTAAHGQEALEVTKDNFFNVIVSDVEMPVMNGIQFFREAFQHDESIAKRFVFCSGRVTEEVKSLCRLHELPYLKKPVSISELRKVVALVCERTI
jgi:CheY-like chemotaxis protein/rubrerythrin